jgi:homoserine O-acetyltransferase
MAHTRRLPVDICKLQGQGDEGVLILRLMMACNDLTIRPGPADANDIIYETEAARSYNPTPKLDKIKAPLLAINSADDEINPPELHILESEIKKVKRGRFVLLPITRETRGHVTHSLPVIWGKYLAELLDESK